MCKVYVIVSGKGGVGKTTMSSGIATVISDYGKKTLLIDMDIGLRNLDIIMGLENKIVYHLFDVLDGRCKIKQALISSRRKDTLFLLPAAQSKSVSELDVKRFGELLIVLREAFDYIIIDSPAGADAGFLNAIKYSDEAIVIVSPDVTSVRDADHILGKLSEFDIPCHKLVINRYRMISGFMGAILGSRDISRILGITDTFIVPESISVINRNNHGSELYKNGTVYKAVKKIADAMM